MSHKLTCSPFEFFFLSPVLMYTAYEILRGKKFNYAGQKIWHECLFASGEAMAHAESAGSQYPTGITNPTTQKSECCINNEAQLKANNNTGHIIATYLQT